MASDEELYKEQPPFFKKWKGWYWLVIGVLAAQIILYYLITIAYS